MGSLGLEERGQERQEERQRFESKRQENGTKGPEAERIRDLQAGQSSSEQSPFARLPNPNLRTGKRRETDCGSRRGQGGSGPRHHMVPII